MELQAGMTAHSGGTFDCDNQGCWYHMDGRCIFNVARLQIPTGKACYEELMESEMEARADYEQGLL